jgi:excisionase family DNA binding protein
MKQIKSPFRTRSEAAEYLRISTQTVDRMIKDRRLETVKVGHLRLVKLESLERAAGRHE